MKTLNYVLAGLMVLSASASFAKIHNVGPQLPERYRTPHYVVPSADGKTSIQVPANVEQNTVVMTGVSVAQTSGEDVVEPRPLYIDVSGVETEDGLPHPDANGDGIITLAEAKIAEGIDPAGLKLTAEEIASVEKEAKKAEYAAFMIPQTPEVPVVGQYKVDESQIALEDTVILSKSHGNADAIAALGIYESEKADQEFITALTKPLKDQVKTAIADVKASKDALINKMKWRSASKEEIIALEAKYDIAKADLKLAKSDLKSANDYVASLNKIEEYKKLIKLESGIIASELRKKLKNSEELVVNYEHDMADYIASVRANTRNINSGESECVVTTVTTPAEDADAAVAGTDIESILERLLAKQDDIRKKRSGKDTSEESKRFEEFMAQYKKDEKEENKKSDYDKIVELVASQQQQIAALTTQIGALTSALAQQGQKFQAPVQGGNTSNDALVAQNNMLMMMLGERRNDTANNADLSAINNTMLGFKTDMSNMTNQMNTLRNDFNNMDNTFMKRPTTIGAPGSMSYS